MSRSATYYKDVGLVFMRYWGELDYLSISGRVAEWMEELNPPSGYFCITDLRGLESVRELPSGTKEFVSLQKQLYRTFASPTKNAICVDGAISHLAGRMFEQYSSEEIATEIELFGDEREALAFVGLPFGSFGDMIAELPMGVTLV